MESTPEPQHSSSENTVHEESEDDFQLILDTLPILFFLIGCLNPVVLLVVLLTVFFGKKKLRGRWLVVCGLVAGLVVGGFFNAVSLYLTPVLDLTDFMRGNMVKLMHGADVIRFDGCTPWTMRDTIKSTPGGNRGVENLSAPLKPPRLSGVSRTHRWKETRAQ